MVVIASVMEWLLPSVKRSLDGYRCPLLFTSFRECPRGVRKYDRVDRPRYLAHCLGKVILAGLGDGARDRRY
jgi:hypothetical protein